MLLAIYLKLFRKTKKASVQLAVCAALISEALPSAASLALSLAVVLGKGYTNVCLTVQLRCVSVDSHSRGGQRDIGKARQKLEGMTYLTPGMWDSTAAKRGMWTGSPLLLWCPSAGHQAQTVCGSCCQSTGVGILPCPAVFHLGRVSQC